MNGQIDGVDECVGWIKEWVQKYIMKYYITLCHSCSKASHPSL